ncbi:Ger(x)C family spore germination protein [Bacillus sp. CGMCC 1.16607]|uniref:Ger(x)C family spore germination protein n=1 Tax=Bacillus sp. CGMCC 1.16607 TaxID=3351842 RepID=UPI0036432074
MIKIVNKWLCVMLLALSLSGCWDQREIEKRAYVYALGMDKSKDKGKFTITLMIVNPEYGSQVQGGGGSDEPPYEAITFEANDLISARNLANSVVAKEITYDLLRVIIVSEDLAREKQFIRLFYDVTKDREIRRDDYFIVTKENVSEFFLKNKPKLETRVHKYYELILKRGIETGMIPDSEVNRFFRVTEADAELYLAIYGTTEKDKKDSNQEEDQVFAGQFNARGETNVTQFLGSAVFKEGKMIGKLTGEETRLSIMLNNTLHMSDVITTVPDPFNEKYQLAARFTKIRDNKIKMDLKNGPGVIDVTIPLHVEILSDHSMVNYAKDAKKRAKLKKSIEERLSKKLENFVKKTQEEFKGEPFGWSLIARNKFQTIPEYEKFDWMKSYPNMKVNIHLDVKYGEFGRQTELPNLKKVRD